MEKKIKNNQLWIESNKKIKRIVSMVAAFIFTMFIGMDTSLASIPQHSHEYAIGDINWCYNVLSDGTIEVAGVESYPPGQILPTKNLVIPNTLPVNGQERPVTRIGNAAFYKGSLNYEDVIESVIIPDTVTAIGDRAFEGIDLISIAIPNEVKSIGGTAFRNCKSLTSVNIGNSVETIGDYAFYNCNQLTSIDIPDSVTDLGIQMFRNCSALTSVTLGKNVSAIRDYTFCDCTSLEAINIPKSVSTVGKGAFYNCQKLTSITIPCDFDKSAFDGDQFFTVSGDEYTITCRNPVGTLSGTFTYTHIYGEPNYTWNYDETEGKWICSAERTCAASGDVTETEDAVATGVVTKQPTCIDKGETTYTAIFTNPNFSTQTKTVEDIDVDPDAHEWESEWSSDDNSHWHKCALCGAITDKAEHEWTKSGIIQEVSEITAGKIKYICSVCGAEKIEVVPPSGGQEDDNQTTGSSDGMGSGIVFPQTGDFMSIFIFEFAGLFSILGMLAFHEN